MKRKLITVLAIISLLFVSAGCGSSAPPSPKSFADMYPQLCSANPGTVSPEKQEALRQSVTSVLETAEEYSEDACTIRVQENYVKATLQISDEWIKYKPENWEDRRTQAEELGTAIASAIEKQGTRGVLHLSDSRGILFTAVDGKIVFDKFDQEKHYEEPPEIDRERIDAILQSAAERRLENEESDVPYWDTDTEIVYVSDRSDTVHRVPDCSGMVHYREMTRGEAAEYGYKYCQNCW